MRIKINGEQTDTNAGTVMELLEGLNIKKGAVAVEVNLAIISRKDYETFKLHDGDCVEIVNFVGGG